MPTSRVTSVRLAASAPPGDSGAEDLDDVAADEQPFSGYDVYFI
jgi:hypothetical protein